ncbi:MAG: hypothetical protein FJ149_12750 [Euryarchaeota archaeon]|nr:hypothetical protein [Euryarchaeota archaeon]
MGMGQGQGNGQNQQGQPGSGPQGPPGGGNGNGQNVGPGPGFKWATRIILTFAEAGTFSNLDGSPVGGDQAISWPKGKPFTVRGTVEYYNEGSGTWMPVNMAVKVAIQLNQSSASYMLWEGLAGNTGDGAFDATCLIPGAAAGGVGKIAIHMLENSQYAETWLIES